jgi:sugar phosphate permease
MSSAAPGSGGFGGDRRVPPARTASEGFTPERAKDRSGPALAVVTAFLALFSIVGFATYGLPFFYDFFVRELGWSRQQVTSGNAYGKVVVGLVFGFAAGVVIDRFGPRRLMLAGILMAGLALVGLGEVHGLGLFYFCYLLNALGYVCGGPLPNQVMLSGWFTTARGRAMGIAYLGIGVGGALVPLVAYALTQALGWRGALRALGLAMIAIAFPVAFFVREPPAAAAVAGAPLGPILRQPAFYFLALASICSIGAVGGTMQNLKLYLSLDRGLSQGQAARILSLILVGSIVGRLLMGWLADRWPKKQVMLLINAIVAATIPLLAFSPTVGMLQVAALLFGVGLGGDYMIIPLMAAELFGLRVLGRVMGIILTADSVSESVVPMAVATMRDHLTSYRPGFMLLIALAALGAVGVAFLPRSSRPE